MSALLTVLFVWIVVIPAGFAVFGWLLAHGRNRDDDRAEGPAARSL